jgi:hypothetical protein
MTTFIKVGLRELSEPYRSEIAEQLFATWLDVLNREEREECNDAA